MDRLNHTARGGDINDVKKKAARCGGLIAVMAMMAVVMMIVAMMVAVPSCGWDRAAGRDYANNA